MPTRIEQVSSLRNEETVAGLGVGAQFRAEELARVVEAGTNLETLIHKLCPNGVRYVPLAELCVFERGSMLSKKATIPGDVPVMAGGRTPAYFHNQANREGETIVVAGSGAYAGYVTYWNTPLFVSDAFSLQTKGSDLKLKFCFYFLQSRQDYLHTLKRGSGVPHVYAKDVQRIVIPFPPVEVQEEIVRILDLFTTLEAELEAELEARRTQYAHYREVLLVPEKCEPNRILSELFQRAPLKEFLAMKAGKHLPAREILSDSSEKASYPAYGANGFRGYTHQCSHTEPALLIGRQGALCGNVHYVQGDYYATEHAVVATLRSAGNIRYFFHLLTHMNLNQFKTQSAQPGLAVSTLNDLVIAVPELTEQKRIADILDRMDALVNDLSTGLPAELEARRKQYAYYRDRLLTFPELPATNPS